MNLVKLQSSDGEIFEVAIQIANYSETIKNLLEAARTENNAKVSNFFFKNHVFD